MLTSRLHCERDIYIAYMLIYGVQVNADVTLTQCIWEFSCVEGTIKFTLSKYGHGIDLGNFWKIQIRYTLGSSSITSRGGGQKYFIIIYNVFSKTHIKKYFPIHNLMSVFCNYSKLFPMVSAYALIIYDIRRLPYSGSR